jgi:hypothetical protein
MWWKCVIQRPGRICDIYACPFRSSRSEATPRFSFRRHANFALVAKRARRQPRDCRHARAPSSPCRERSIRSASSSALSAAATCPASIVNKGQCHCEVILSFISELPSRRLRAAHNYSRVDFESLNRCTALCCTSQHLSTLIEHDTSGVGPARSVKCSQRLSAHVLKQRKIKKKKPPNIRNAVVSNALRTHSTGSL